MIDMDNFIDEAKRICRKYQIDLAIRLINDDNVKEKVMKQNNELIFNLSKIREVYGEDYFWYVLRDEMMPFLHFETERLIIRRVQKQDIEDLFAMVSYEPGCLDDGFEPFTKMDDAFDQYFEGLLNDKTRYVAELKISHQVIGIINMMKKNDRAIDYFEVGYAFNQHFWRQGYGYEAVSEMLSRAFIDLHIPMVTAGVFEWNEKSQKMLDKLGFKKEGVLHKAVLHERYGPVNLISYVKDFSDQ